MIKNTGAIKAMNRILGVMLLAGIVGGIVPRGFSEECGASLYQRRRKNSDTNVLRRPLGSKLKPGRNRSRLRLKARLNECWSQDTRT